jgi:PPM family protein phosphatase
MLEVNFGQASNPGKVRTNNEDAMGVFVPISRQQARSLGWMFVVADGVGGMDLGEVASAKAVEVMSEGFAQAQDCTSLLSLMPRLIQHANAAVHDEGLTAERRGKHMATTIVVCALRYDQACIANVGDSRCYLVRDRQATILTHDHTWVNEQRKLGLLSADEAAHSESRHILTRTLGPELFVSADTNNITLRPRDVLVLCTDGLYGKLENKDIVRIVTQNKDADEIAQELVNYSLEVDGADNTTAQVISIRAVEAMAMYRGRLYPRPGA